MDPRVTLNPKGGYRFLPGIEPYSSGVIAEIGHEIIHVTLARPLPWHKGLVAARRYLEWLGHERHALCGVELRCPTPHTMDGFIEFNRKYRSLLEEWDILVDGENPVARTNVAPVTSPPNETVLYGFSYAIPSQSFARTFVVAGGGELPTRKLDERRIVRLGEITAEAMLEKARCVVDIMRTRLEGLGVTDEQLTMIDVYTAHDLRVSLAEVLIPGLPAAAKLGVRWFYSRPPIRNIEFEMDMRGVEKELVLDLES
ncbi:MAG: RidA family protein [Planctomycetes bacterium]|nr:RidA family protein [Planctomycetota bacterium]